MVRSVTEKLVLLLALFSFLLQGMVNAGKLGCQMESGANSMSFGSATMSANGMGMGERCKTSPLGAGDCKVCPSCSLCCPAAACIDSHASAPITLALSFADVQVRLPPLMFPSPIKHPPRSSISLG